MHRRGLLAAAGGIFLAGCTSGSPSTDSSPTPTETPTQTPTPTDTPTPVPEPSIVRQNLLTHWAEFGDVEENEVAAVGKGGRAVIGWRYDLPVHDGKSEEFVQVTIFESGGASVATKKESDEQISNTSGSETFERWFAFDTTDWEKGDYTAEILVRDEISGKNSGVELVEFSLNEPFSEGDAVIQDYAPDTVSAGEEVTLSLTFSNTTNRASSVVSRFSARFGNNDWRPVSDNNFRLNLGANGTRTYEGSATTFDRAGEYTYRLDAIGETFSIEVIE